MINTTLTVITGLHIGGADDTMKIGGVDSPVIKREVFVNKNSGKIDFNTSTESNEICKLTEPYIPGSSLKGKIRSLLEWKLGLIEKFKQPNCIDSTVEKNQNLDSLTKNKIKLIVKLFGESGSIKSEGHNIRVTRAIFRDSFITNEVRKKASDGIIELSERKYENSIDRVSGTVNSKAGGLRQIERVPAGIVFDIEIGLREFAEDKELPLKEALILGLKLLEKDTLGGAGSRGYGMVEFSDYKNKEIKNLLDTIEEKLK